MRTHTVVLPSKGKVNGIGESVTFHEMGVDVEKEILSNRTPVQKIINIVQQCVEGPENLQVGELPLVDIMYLLFEIRAFSLDKEYPYPIQCNFCNFSFQHTVLIPDDFEVKYAPDDTEETAEVELPSGTKLTVSPRPGSTRNRGESQNHAPKQE